jgi:hypothetical protein
VKVGCRLPEQRGRLRGGGEPQDAGDAMDRLAFQHDSPRHPTAKWRIGGSKAPARERPASASWPSEIEHQASEIRH